MLNEEEIEAIKALKSYTNAIDTFGTIDYKCINNLYAPAKTVLNLISKLQKENELAKEQLIKKQCEVADERNDLLVKINKLEKENDLMAEEIRKTILIVKPESRFCQYENDCKNIRCKDCIKQYYEKLAKEENNNE